MSKRWTAYKLTAKEVVDGNYTEGGFIQHGNMQVNRVRILGSVVSKFVSTDRNYGFFIIDDGTETIRVRSFEDAFDLIQKAEIGDVVDVIGKLKKYEEEIYVIPEIVKKIDEPNLEILRKIELLKQEKIGKSEPDEMIITEENVEENPRQKILKKIAELDSGDGADIEKLHEDMDQELVERVLTDLMNDGDIFEPRPGKVKILS